MYEKGLITVLVMALLLVVVAIPLVLRKVPRNVVYGYRTAATLNRDDVWYAVNARFGRNVVIAALCGAVAIVVLYLVRPGGVDFIAVSVLTIVVPIIVAVVATRRYSRGLMHVKGD